MAGPGGGAGAGGRGPSRGKRAVTRCGGPTGGLTSRHLGHEPIDGSDGIERAAHASNGAALLC